MSVGQESDTILTVNLPFIAGAYTFWLSTGYPMPAQFMTLCPWQPIDPVKYPHSECLIDSWTIRQHLFSRTSFAVDQGNAILFNPLAQPHWPPNLYACFPHPITPSHPPVSFVRRIFLNAIVRRGGGGGGGVVVWWCGGVVVWWCGGVVGGGGRRAVSIIIFRCS